MAGDNNTQTFSFEFVAVIVAALKESGGVCGKQAYDQMALLDGTRTASGFEHLFRKVKARANELITAQDGAAPATPKTKTKTNGNGKGKNGTPGTGASTGGKKRGRKQAAEADANADDGESPSKKIKEEAPAGGDDLDEL